MCEHDTKVLQFLYDKRLELLNYRRNIEWRSFFWLMAFYGAGDTALVMKKINLLEESYIVVWAVLCLGMLVRYMWFAWALQTRNYTDRQVMNIINNRLCHSLGLTEEKDAPLFQISNHKEIEKDGVWAYGWQVSVASVVALVSSLLPLLVGVNAPT